MGHGIRDVKIKERGIALTITVRKEKLEINPGPGDILRLSAALEAIRKRMEKEKREDPSLFDQAEIADLLFVHLAGPYLDKIKALPPEMQMDINDEMWNWWVDLDISSDDMDPTRGSSDSPTTREVA